MHQNLIDQPRSCNAGASSDSASMCCTLAIMDGIGNGAWDRDGYKTEVTRMVLIRTNLKLRIRMATWTGMRSRE